MEPWRAGNVQRHTSVRSTHWKAPITASHIQVGPLCFRVGLLNKQNEANNNSFDLWIKSRQPKTNFVRNQLWIYLLNYCIFIGLHIYLFSLNQIKSIYLTSSMYYKKNQNSQFAFNKWCTKKSSLFWGL